jgi:DNA-binding transcriptional ArsR family regulator
MRDKAKRRGRARKRDRPLRKVGKNTTIDESKLKRFMDPNLAFALSHAVREHVLVVLNERIASPSEVGEEIGVGASYISYHFTELRERGLIELVEKRQVRGVWEHFYRAKTTLYFDDREWERLPLTFRSSLSLDHLRSIYGEAVKAVLAGTFGSGSGTHLSWTTMRVDKKGWEDTMAVVAEALEGVLAIRTECAERLAGASEEAIPTTVAMMSFKTSAGPVPQE